MAAPGYTRAAELEGLAARDWGDYVPDTVAGELAAQRRRERAANASLHQSYDEPRHIVDMAWCKWRTMEGRPEASVAITDARRKLAVLRGGSTIRSICALPRRLPRFKTLMTLPACRTCRLRLVPAPSPRRKRRPPRMHLPLRPPRRQLAAHRRPPAPRRS